MIAKYFWLVMTIACVVWYSTITIYVSIKGAKDIKHMLKHLDVLRVEAEKEALESDTTKPA